MHAHNRRSFLKQSLVLTAGAALLRPGSSVVNSASAATARLQSIRLGGPAFANTQDMEELVLAHRKLGYRAAYCPGLSLKDPDKIRACSEAFAKHDVVIAEVGRWVNLMDADPEKRRKNMETVTDGLALAEAVGARCCVDIAGSFNPTSWFGPDAKNLTREHFDTSVENARKIIDAVKPRRAKFCYEMMGWAYPDSADSCLKMLKAVDRKSFGVHLDPCNLINSPEKFYGNAALLNECFKKLGPWIVSCHAKDLAWEVEMNIHFREVQPGKGVLDYETFLKDVARLPHNPPLMLEHLSSAQEYTAAREHIFAMGRKAGLQFE